MQHHDNLFKYFLSKIAGYFGASPLVWDANNSHVEVDNRSNFGLYLKREFSQVVVKPHLTLPTLSQDSLGFFGFGEALWHF